MSRGGGAGGGSGGKQGKGFEAQHQSSKITGWLRGRRSAGQAAVLGITASRPPPARCQLHPSSGIRTNENVSRHRPVSPGGLNHPRIETPALENSLQQGFDSWWTRVANALRSMD